MTFTGPIAYLTGEYPRASDTFIQREVAALRDQGITVLTCSIRKTGEEHLVGKEQRAEAARTFNVLRSAQRPLHLIKCHAKIFARAPRRFFSALGLALRARPPGLRGLLYQLFYFVEATILAHHMQENKVQHLHNHIAKSSCSVAMLSSRLSGIPFSFTLHGPDIFYEPYHWRLDVKIVEAAFVSCISEFCRSQAMAFSDPKHWAKLHIVHCGIDPERYQGNATQRNGSQILFVGRLARVKGVSLLLDVISNLRQNHPDLHLTLIGDGPERSYLEAQAQELDIYDMVTFAGYKSQDAVAAALQRSDIFVLPSFAEGVPVVLMEAMAAGLPVISTRIAGIPELVEDGVSGVLVSPGNAKMLQESLCYLLDNSDLRNKIGQCGRDRVKKHFNITQEAAHLCTIMATFHTQASDRATHLKRGA